MEIHFSWCTITTLGHTKSKHQKSDSKKHILHTEPECVWKKTHLELRHSSDCDLVETLKPHIHMEIHFSFCFLSAEPTPRKTSHLQHHSLSHQDLAPQTEVLIQFWEVQCLKSDKAWTETDTVPAVWNHRSYMDLAAGRWQNLQEPKWKLALVSQHSSTQGGCV